MNNFHYPRLTLTLPRHSPCTDDITRSLNHFTAHCCDTAISLGGSNYEADDTCRHGSPKQTTIRHVFFFFSPRRSSTSDGRQLGSDRGFYLRRMPRPARWPVRTKYTLLYRAWQIAFICLWPRGGTEWTHFLASTRSERRGNTEYFVEASWRVLIDVYMLCTGATWPHQGREHSTTLSVTQLALLLSDWTRSKSDFDSRYEMFRIHSVCGFFYRVPVLTDRDTVERPTYNMRSVGLYTYSLADSRSNQHKSINQSINRSLSDQGLKHCF